MVDLLEARRRILLNTPHLESISGATASFETNIASNLKECKIHFTPIQEGSGDPSPDNVRPIHGWDSITIYNGQTAVATIPFPQTIYGGYVDLIKGEVVEEWNSSTIDGDERISNSSNRFYVQNAFPENAVNTTESISDKYKYSNSIYATSPYGRFTVRNKNIYMTPPDGTDIARNDVDTFKAWLVDNHVGFCYELVTPTTYPLDPVTIRTLRGMNNIWSDANGNIEIKYWTH